MKNCCWYCQREECELHGRSCNKPQPKGCDTCEPCDSFKAENWQFDK